MKETRVIIADDHDMFRECLTALLRQNSCGIQIVGHADGGIALINLVREIECDLILLDIVMPGPDSLDILKTLRTEFPHIPVLMMSGLPEDEFAIRYLKAGASGYLCKDKSIDELLESIKKVSNGHTAISPVIMDKLALGNLQKEVLTTHEILSDREFQVMCLMSSGKTLAEVAAGLCLSPKTISTYRNNIMEKMGWENNAQMMHYSISCGLCDPNFPSGV